MWVTVCCSCVLILCLFTFSDAVRIRQNAISGVNSFSQIQPQTVSNGRSKRDVSSSGSTLCNVTQANFDEKIRNMNAEARKIFAEEIEFSGDNKFSLQLAWTGNDGERIIVLTSEDSISSCYLSDVTGKRFTNISSRLNGATENHELALQKHPLDSKTVYIVANAFLDTVSHLYITRDSGITFSQVSLPFQLLGSLIFHPTIWDYILALDDSSQELFISLDRGTNWRNIKASVISVKWSTAVNSTHIFVITGDSISIFTDSHSNVLEKSEDLGNNWRKLYEHVHSFGLGGKFLYASAYLSELSGDERKLIVSSDGGNSWNHARLPSVTSDRFYSILDSSEGQIFLHVDNPGDTGRGTLYLSDATGIIFSKSLDDHLYPNYEDLTDFYVVQSMRGVYIASQLSPDNSIHTMITYNRGGEWQPIARPDGLPCEDESKKCYLQIHNLYSLKRGIRANPPLSVPNAVGIILVHGHIAESLQQTDPDVFVSSDGGYTWRWALKGPHHYQIADHGGLLVAVPADTETPSIVKFSTDQGRCWISYTFTNETIRFTGLLVEPGNRAMTAAIWGYTDQRIWHTHVINFTAIVDRQCESDDYEDWVAHIHNDDKGCLLGKKETFRRLKKYSWCYNGKAYQVEKTSTSCDCTSDDYDCDFGYIRRDEICVEDPTVTDKQLDICKRGHEERFVPLGYHKIPGDACVNGFTPREAQIVDLLSKCGDDTVGPDVEHGEDKVRQEQDESVAAKQASHKKASVIVVVMVLAVIAIVIVLLTIYARKYRVRHLSFRYMSIKADGPLTLAKHSSTSLYDDSSDEEPSAVEVHSSLSAANATSTPNGHAVNGTAKSSKWSSVNHESDDDILH